MTSCHLVKWNEIKIEYKLNGPFSSLSGDASRVAFSNSDPLVRISHVIGGAEQPVPTDAIGDGSTLGRKPDE